MCTILPKCKLLTFLDYQTCYQIKVETLHFNPIAYAMIGYANHFMIIFLNINLHSRKERKMVIKLRGVPTKLLIS